MDGKPQESEWIAGGWIISSHSAWPPGSWEKHGGWPCDGKEPLPHEAEIRQHHRDILKRWSAERVADAITALHSQQTADGRPRCFIPQTDEA